MSRGCNKKMVVVYLLLLSVVGSMGGKKAKLGKRVKELEDMVAGLKDKVGVLEKKCRTGVAIGFTAYKSKYGNRFQFLVNKITFDKTIYNQGPEGDDLVPYQPYSTTSGIFTCPKTGAYFFTFSLNTEEIAGTAAGTWNKIVGALLRNGKEVVAARAQVLPLDGGATESKYTLQITQSAVVPCFKGDKIQVSQKEPKVVMCIGSTETDRRCTFSGFYIGPILA